MENIACKLFIAMLHGLGCSYFLITSYGSFSYVVNLN